MSPSPQGNLVSTTSTKTSTSTSSSILSVQIPTGISSSSTATSSKSTTGSNTPEQGVFQTTSTIAPTTATGVSSPNASSGKSFTTGTVIGTAIGAVIGGALLAFIITFLFMRSRRQPPIKENTRSGKKQHSRNFLLAANASEKPSDDGFNTQHGWEKHLPQPADDESIRMTMKTLFNQIELHVEHFYSNLTSVHMTEALQTQVLRFDSDQLPATNAILITQTRSPTVVIKHCLSRSICTSISADSSPRHSFLPVEFAALPSAVGVAKATNQPAFEQALSHWRVLSSYLRPNITDNPAYIRQRDAAVFASAQAFCDTFSPWASSSQSDAARTQNLIEIMRSASEAGLLIFAQPSTFKYGWSLPLESRGKRSTVVTPAFVKVTDNNARLLNNPQTLVPQLVNEL